MEYRDNMTIKEMMQYIAEAQVIWNRKKKRYATFEEIEDDWLHGSGPESLGNKMLGTTNLMMWFESAKAAAGVYGTFTTVAKTNIKTGVPFVVDGPPPEKPNNELIRLFEGVLPIGTK